MKSKKIKIKHRKYNLYNRKKSKGKQALAIILTIVIAAALCVLGFGLGRPLMEYFNGNKQQTTSQSSESTSESTSGTASQSNTESTDDTSEPAPDEIENTEVHYISSAALKSVATLDRALATAKSKGCTTVVVTLRESGGTFLYKTAIEGVKDNEELTNALTAKEIFDAVDGAGMNAYARICTLRDHVSGGYIAGIKYMTADGYGWLDAAPNNGGKPWLSPFESKTLKYLGEITAELSSAGFEKIILTDTMYPAFHPADYDKYLSHISKLNDSNHRAAVLWRVVSSCQSAAKSNGADVMVEMNMEDITSAEKLGTSAEMANDRTKLSTAELLIVFSSQGKDPYTAAKSFIGQMKATYGNMKFSVVLSKGETERAEKAFLEENITVFYE
ncbi:MAG: hypothetical protein IJD85_01120 [Oscillospiraceae bacterium]|nr:hypothetical protein [Oscillospiraceae bacterium]